MVMSSAGLGTKIECAGEGQEQFTRPTNWPVVHVLHDAQNRETVKYVMSPAGLGIKNDCAGEGQQQFTRPDQIPAVVGPLLSLKRRPHFKTRKSLGNKIIWSWVQTGPETKNYCAGEGQKFHRPADPENILLQIHSTRSIVGFCSPQPQTAASAATITTPTATFFRTT
jgi:hypothetical protein